MGRRYGEKNGIEAKKRGIKNLNLPITFFSRECSTGPCGERCTETFDAVSDMKARLCGVVDWLFENPDYDPKPKVIPKEKYPVLVDVTF